MSALPASEDEPAQPSCSGAPCLGPRRVGCSFARLPAQSKWDFAALDWHTKASLMQRNSGPMKGRIVSAPPAVFRSSPTANFLGSFSPFFVFALFALVGVLLVGDYYYVTYDEFDSRHLAIATLSYIAGADDILLQHHIQTYGVAFELLLLFVERLLDLEDLQKIYITRYLLTHLYFLVGGLFCYLLVRRMGGSRVVGLFAMLLFLLHSRLYAHSFFNTKDLPFLSLSRLLVQPTRCCTNSFLYITQH